MNKEDIKWVLNCPSKPLLMLALELVNLKDKERLAVELVDIRGMTQEKASIKIDCSIKSVTNYRTKAYKKMAKAWQNNELINKILREG